MNKLKNDNDNDDTLRSIGPSGKNIFDEALKLKINSKLIEPIRIINTGSNCWVNNVAITQTYYPIQVRHDRYEEIRYRSIGITVGSSSNITIFDCEIGDILNIISGNTSRITALSLSIPPSGKNLVPLFIVGDADGYLRLYDLQSGELMAPLLASLKHHGPITSVFINENLKSYIFAAIENDFVIIKIDSEKVDTVINDHIASVKCISACTQRSHEDVSYNIVCTGGHDGYVYGYDILTLEKILSLEIGLLINSIDVKFISCMEVCLVLGTFEGNVQVHELTQNMMLHNIHCSDKPIHAVTIIETTVPGFIIAGADLEIKIYDLREGVHLISLYGCHIDCIRTIDVTIDPRFIIVSGGFDNKTVVYDIHKIAQNDENMRLLLSHLKLKPFKFESKKVYLFDNSIDETSSVITEVSTFLTDLNKDNDETK